jgi:Recombination endonuclease VII
MTWKPEYADTRRRKYQSDPAERVRRLGQTRSPEENREYMQKYYGANKDKWRARRNDPEVKERRSKLRKERYANDAEFRERCKKAARNIDPAKRRAQRLRRQYGISAAEFDELIQSQGGGCAICRSPVGDGIDRPLYVDHCHKSGRVRGLLCSSCNFGIGKFRDDVALLARAIDYLEGRLTWETY